MGPLLFTSRRATGGPKSADRRDVHRWVCSIAGRAAPHKPSRPRRPAAALNYENASQGRDEDPPVCSPTGSR